MVTLENLFDTMKSFRLYSQCFHLNLKTIFLMKVDAPKVQMRSDFLKQYNVGEKPTVILYIHVTLIAMMQGYQTKNKNKT